MATVRDVIKRALRQSTVIDKYREPEAEEMAYGLDAINDMLSGWAAKGVDVAHADYASVSDTFETDTLTAEYRGDVTWCLASELATEYGLTLSAVAEARARDAWRTMQANFLISEDQKVDRGLNSMPSQAWGFSRYNFT
ncbi:MAG: hypothetical protein ACPGGK_16400 [Pikeienuella sp.]